MTSKRHLIEGDVLCVAKDGEAAGVRRTLNLLEGANVSLTVAENEEQDCIDVTVAASSSGVTQAAIEAALTHVAFDDAALLLAGSGGQVAVDGLKVLGARQPAIATATTGTAVATLNAVLTALRNHGLIALT